MTYLAESDAGYAAEIARKLECEILCKRVRARIYLECDGSVDYRKAQVETHPEVTAADDELIKAVVAHETRKARRHRAEIVIDVFRTLEASRRKA